MTSPDAPSRGSTDRPAQQRGRLGRPSPPSRPPSPPPWRVEGAPRETPPRQRSNWNRSWWLLLALLVLNWIVSSVVLGPAPRTEGGYTVFTRQGDAANVKEITSTADRIAEVFREKVEDPP